jgi:uncharacterized repeat protein (TIGR03803 family)
MQSQAQRLISLFRTIVLAGVTAFLITSAALPMPAQNSVPPTAVQAARMPQFAKRLAHPGGQPASAPNPALARQGSRTGPGQGSGTVYENGPINGNTDAWTINFGFVASDTFTVPSDGSPVTGMSFGAWLSPGDTLSQVEISITSGPNGGTFYFDQYVNFSQPGCNVNEYGYNVCAVTTSFNGPTLNAGTYWVNLQNASTSSSDPAYWDENSGVGCMSDGCPSQADENNVGTIPSESFTMLGSTGPTCPEYQGSLQIIQSFTRPQAGASGPSGVTIHNAGNLYGTTYIGGDNGAGFAYKLARFGDSTLAATPWREKVLHSFGSGADGIDPTSGLIIDAAGNLYGTTAQGGTRNCGTVFELSPAQGGGWIETVLHSFNNNGTDGWYPSRDGLVGDAAGNLYGTTIYGPGDGIVFEVSPSEGGGWSEKVIYAFGSQGDGRNPNGSLVFDAAGNLYGTTSNGGIYCVDNQGCGTVFELSPTQGGGWTEKVLHSFNDDGIDGVGPAAGLILDGAGNLYGTTGEGGTPGGEGTVFELSPTQDSWTEKVLHTFGPLPDGEDPWAGLVFDAAGNLYGTTIEGGAYNYGTVFELSPTQSGGWTETVLHSFNNNGTDGFEPVNGSLILDAAGNLYGTTQSGGNTGEGTVFEISPNGNGGWTERVLHSFDNPADGNWPLAGLTFDAAGNLYGTAELSGAYGAGTVFELTPVRPCTRCSHAGLR